MRAALAAVLVLALLGGCGAGTRPVADEPPAPQAGPQVATRTPTSAPATPRPERPGEQPAARPASVVLVLMDDFSMDLLRTMPQARVMQREGASYENAYVVDSLCCVSRSSLLTGQYPHQTGVLTNTANTPNPVGPLGGWEAFESYGNTRRSVNVRLQRAGWTTGYVGKFLNQYQYVPGAAPPPVPAGWTDWQPVFSNAYNGWDFDVLEADEDGVDVDHVDAPPRDASEEAKDAAYVGTVIAERALDFVREHRDDRAPYFLTVATYGTHARVGPDPHYRGDPGFPPAFRDRATAGRPGNCGAVACSDLGVADLPGFGDDQADNRPRRADGSRAPQWRPDVPAVGRASAVATLRARAQMAQSIDRMVARIREEAGPGTHVVLTSDNGFHVGQHGLDRGKGTPFASDVQVPLLVTGPGVVPGVRSELVSNLDLAPTLEELAGLRPAAYRSGTSLLPGLVDPTADRRRYTFFEHTWAPSLGVDPDAAHAGGTTDSVPSYLAVRSHDGLLVRLDLDPSWEGTDHAWEFYDYGATGWEQANGYADPVHRDDVSRLAERMAAFEECLRFTRDDAVPDRCRSLTR
ncbi:MAG TPA: sulfatase-like hydrolase/transferase [Nocardioides sp.]|nr:sulfatase-like hydrolase/transferase [Nocardioides sp.]